MLTDQDIKKLIEAEKEVFTTKGDFELLRTDFRTLQTSVDSYAKLADTYYKELWFWWARYRGWRIGFRLFQLRLELSTNRRRLRRFYREAGKRKFQ